MNYSHFALWGKKKHFYDKFNLVKLLDGQRYSSSDALWDAD